jgi:hypothetical protein
VPTAPGLDDASLLLHPVVIGVLPVAAGAGARVVSEDARALVAAGADLVEPLPVGAAQTGDLSTAERVATLTEAGVPAVVTVSGVADVHLAVGSGAVLLRRSEAPVPPRAPGEHLADHDLREALGASHRPVIQPADDATIATVVVDGLPPFADARPVTVPLAPDSPMGSHTLLELPLSVIAAPRRGQAVKPEGLNTVVPVVADIDAGHAAEHSVVVAQVTAALRAGVRIFRTPDPRTVRRAVHVISAVEAAG